MDDPVRAVLETGEIDVEGRMPWSSNGTFLVRVSCGDQWLRAIYKPAPRRATPVGLPGRSRPT